LTCSYVYWAAENSTQIRRAPATGGTPVTLVTTNETITQIAVKNGFIYWITIGGTSIQRASVQGGAAQTIVANQNMPLRFDTDGTNLYWFNSGPSPQLFVESLDAGGFPIRLLTTRALGSVVVDGADLYFGGDSLRRLPR
jgi:hypothetical protein